MSKNRYAVEVHNVKKSFYLPHHKNNSLKTAITQVFEPKTKGGNTFNALNGVSFNVEKGDFFGILGRNGSGKSTLLKIISEIYQPTSGNVKHDGKLVSFIELGVGFKAELSGRENVFLNGALLGFSRSEVDAMYDDIVAFAELEKFMDQKLKNYSSGMKVRLAFSLAIRARADILILDEVLAVGDASFQKKCNDYFRTLKNDGKTVILVTHNMNAVREYCNKALVIEQGKILVGGSADVAADEYLKLFHTEEKAGDVSATPQQGKRWGVGGVRIEGVHVVCNSKEFIVKTTLRSTEKDINEVRFGLRIKDVNGNLVAGVNNLNAINGQRLVFKTKDDKKNLTFSSSNIFGNQQYSIHATVLSPDSLTVYDDWEDAVKFESATENAYYPTVCPARLTIE